MIPVKRSVEYYRKYNDDFTAGGEFVGRYDISEIPLTKIKRIVIPKEDDIFLYEQYNLDEKQLDVIISLLNTSFIYSLRDYDYCLACNAIKGYYDKHRVTGKRKGGYPAPDLE